MNNVSTQPKTTKTSTPKTPLWRHWPFHKIVYLFHWVMLLCAFFVTRDKRLPFTLETLNDLRIALILVAATVGSFCFWRIIAPTSTFVTRIIGFLFFPAKIIFMPVSLSMEAYSLRKKAPGRIPFFSIYLTFLLTALSIAFFDNNLVRLSIISYVLWTLLFFTLLACVRWSINPLRFLQLVLKGWELALEDVKKEEKKGVNPIVIPLMLAAAANKKNKDIAETREWLNRFGAWCRKQHVLTGFFLTIYLAIICTSVIIFAAIYRVLQLTTPGGIFTLAASFSSSDYIYFSVREFFGAETYGMSINSNAAHWALMAESASQFFLLVVVILTFTTLSEPLAEQTANSYFAKLAESNKTSTSAAPGGEIVDTPAQTASDVKKDNENEPVI